MVVPDVGEQLDGGGGHHRDAEGHRAERDERRAHRRGIGGGLELLAVDQEEGQDDPGDERLLDVGSGQHVEHDGAAEEGHRHPPGPPLAPQDAPSEGDQGQAGQGHQGAGGDAGPYRQELLERMEAPVQGRGDGVQEVDDPGDEDGGGGPAADPAGPAVGLAEVGRRRPRVAHRVGGDQRRVEGPADPAAGDDPLEPARRGELVVGEQHAHVQLGPRLDLDPADPLAVEEDGGQAEPAPVLGHHFGGGAHVGVEAGTEIGQLRPERGRGDQAGIALGHQAPGVVPGRVVGPGPGLHLGQGPAAQDRPHPAAEEPEHQRPGRPARRAPPPGRSPAGR